MQCIPSWEPGVLEAGAGNTPPRPGNQVNSPWQKGFLPDDVRCFEVDKVRVQHVLAVQSLRRLNDCITCRQAIENKPNPTNKVNKGMRLKA